MVSKADGTIMVTSTGVTIMVPTVDGTIMVTSTGVTIMVPTVDGTVVVTSERNRLMVHERTPIILCIVLVGSFIGSYDRYL